MTLKLVAQYGDACNINGDVDTDHRRLEILKRHWDDVDRDYDDISRSTGMTIRLVEKESSVESETAEARGERSLEEYREVAIVGTAEAIKARLQPYLDAGINYFLVTIPRTAYDRTMQTQFARQVVPLFAS